MPQPSSEAIARLSKRQWQALYWAGAPMSSSEIARHMGGIMPDTVDQHIKSACAKLGVSDRREAARWVRASLGSVAVPEDWVSQTLGMVTSAAHVLEDARRRTETDAPREHTSPQLDARGLRDDPPAPDPGIRPSDGHPPGPGASGGSSEPQPPGDAPRAAEPDCGRRLVGDSAAAIPGFGVFQGAAHELIPSVLRVPAVSAAGLLFVLLLIAGLYALILGVNAAHSGLR